MSIQPRARIVLAGLTTVLLWASSFVVIRGVGSTYGPGELSLLRMLAGSATLTLLVLHRGVTWPPRRAWPGLAVLGLAWFAAYNLALNAAEHTLDAGTTAMLVNIAPLLVVVGAGLLLGEGFPRALLFGAPVAFGGVVLIGIGATAAQLSAVGVFLAVVAAVLYAGSTLLQKRLLAEIDGLTCTWLAALIGTVALLPWLPSLIGDVGAAPAPATWGVLYLGVFPTAIAFTTWAYVLSRASAGQTSVTTYVIPAITVALSWWLLGEVPGALSLIGGLLCLLGVGIARVGGGRSARAKREPAAQRRSANAYAAPAATAAAAPTAGFAGGEISPERG